MMYYVINFVLKKVTHIVSTHDFMINVLKSELKVSRTTKGAIVKVKKNAINFTFNLTSFGFLTLD